MQNQNKGLGHVDQEWQVWRNFNIFRDIVKASHLRPLEKGEAPQTTNKKRGLWNSIANQRHQCGAKEPMNLEVYPSHTLVIKQY